MSAGANCKFHGLFGSFAEITAQVRAGTQYPPEIGDTARYRLADGTLGECSFGASGWRIDRQVTPSGDVQFGVAVGAANLQGNLVGRRVIFAGNSIAQQCLPSGQSGSIYWQPTTAQTVGQYMMPRYVDLRGGYIPKAAICRTAGNTGTSEPVWGPIGSFHTDGGVVWEMVAQTSNVSVRGGGYLAWAQALSGQALDVQWIVGQAGARCDALLDHLQSLAPVSGSDGVFFGPIWENDVLQGDIPRTETAWARWAAYADLLRASGKTVFCQTVLPMSSIDWNGSAYVPGNSTKLWWWLNAKIREYASSRRDVIFADVVDGYKSLDPATPVWSDVATTYPLGNLTTQTILDSIDRTHPKWVGAFLIGKIWAPVLEERFGRREFFDPAGSENQRSANPFMYGTTGTMSTNVTGVCATAQRTSSSASASAVCSKITGPKSDPQQNVIAATATGQFNYLISQPGTPIAPIAVGEMIQAFAEIKILANPVGFTGPYVQLLFNGSTGIAKADMCVYEDTAQQIGSVIKTDTTLLLATWPIPLPAGTTVLQLRQEMSVSGTPGAPAATTVQFVRESIRRPITPDIA